VERCDLRLILISIQTRCARLDYANGARICWIVGMCDCQSMYCNGHWKSLCSFLPVSLRVLRVFLLFVYVGEGAFLMP
jgi:hypothetical protein